MDMLSEDQLVKDFKEVISDAETLLKATIDSGDEKLSEVRSRMEKSIKQAKTAMGESQSAVIDKARAATKVADAYVHENPWRTIGFAASVGAIIGMLIGRR
jgi:ElaB/YqjD/DUF883 family membrane-anchored ribosome-binding protein